MILFSKASKYLNQKYVLKIILIKSVHLATYLATNSVTESTENVLCVKRLRHNIVRVVTLDNRVFKTVNDLDTACIVGAGVETGIFLPLPTHGPEKPRKVSGEGIRMRNRHLEVTLSRFTIRCSATISLSCNWDIPKLSCMHIAIVRLLSM